jgi:hypothetical protein
VKWKPLWSTREVIHSLGKLLRSYRVMKSWETFRKFYWILCSCWYSCRFYCPELFSFTCYAPTKVLAYALDITTSLEAYDQLHSSRSTGSFSSHHTKHFCSGLSDAVSFTVVLIVASIPIAIEIVCTTTLALGSKELTKHGAIVTRLGRFGSNPSPICSKYTFLDCRLYHALISLTPSCIIIILAAIEDLAGMSILCSDKTGTLTMNKMVIQDHTPTYTSGMLREWLRH